MSVPLERLVEAGLHDPNAADAEQRLARAKTTLTVQEILSAVHADRK